jgi:hypothetical protein
MPHLLLLEKSPQRRFTEIQTSGVSKTALQVRLWRPGHRLQRRKQANLWTFFKTRKVRLAPGQHAFKAVQGRPAGHIFPKPHVTQRPVEPRRIALSSCARPVLTGARGGELNLNPSSTRSL